MKLKYLIVLLVIFLVLSECNCKKRKGKQAKGMVLRQKETNPIEFIRLTVMRLIYGIATRIGFGEQISEALGGAFVPPGADYDEYGSVFGGDDYDY